MNQALIFINLFFMLSMPLLAIVNLSPIVLLIITGVTVAVSIVFLFMIAQAIMTNKTLKFNANQDKIGSIQPTLYTPSADSLTSYEAPPIFVSEPKAFDEVILSPEYKKTNIETSATHEEMPVFSEAVHAHQTAWQPVVHVPVYEPQIDNSIMYEPKPPVALDEISNENITKHIGENEQIIPNAQIAYQEPLALDEVQLPPQYQPQLPPQYYIPEQNYYQPNAQDLMQHNIAEPEFNQEQISPQVIILQSPGYQPQPMTQPIIINQAPPPQPAIILQQPPLSNPAPMMQPPMITQPLMPSLTPILTYPNPMQFAPFYPPPPMPQIVVASCPQHNKQCISAPLCSGLNETKKPLETSKNLQCSNLETNNSINKAESIHKPIESKPFIEPPLDFSSRLVPMANFKIDEPIKDNRVYGGAVNEVKKPLIHPLPRTINERIKTAEGIYQHVGMMLSNIDERPLIDAVLNIENRLKEQEELRYWQEEEAMREIIAQRELETQRQLQMKRELDELKEQQRLQQERELRVQRDLEELIAQMELLKGQEFLALQAQQKIDEEVIIEDKILEKHDNFELNAQEDIKLPPSNMSDRYAMIFPLTRIEIADETKRANISGVEVVERYDKPAAPTSLKINGKTYAMLHGTDMGISMTVKIPDAYAHELCRKHKRVQTAKFPKGANWYHVPIDESFETKEQVYRILNNSMQYIANMPKSEPKVTVPKVVAAKQKIREQKNSASGSSGGGNYPRSIGGNGAVSKTGYPRGGVRK
ncbi:MAG: hypothetical protein FWE03_04395 [Firmicutes bacterium]|nr:hypothetical protein [Bacillota bacterium]